MIIRNCSALMRHLSQLETHYTQGDLLGEGEVFFQLIKKIYLQQEGRKEAYSGDEALLDRDELLRH